MKSDLPRYRRTSSTELLKLLREGEFLSPLVGLSRKQTGNYDLPLDVHLRLGDEVHVYCGLTRLVTAKRRKSGSIKIWAAKAYEDQDREKRLFRDWNSDEFGFEEALDSYLHKVEVDSGWIAKEGKVQADWACVTNPWIPFDREAVIEYRDNEQAEMQRNYAQVESARALLNTIAAERPGLRGERWADPPVAGKELDQLAIDRDGNLVLIEIKFAGKGANAAQLYYSPLQLLQYIHEWHDALKWLSVWRDLHNLIGARARLGLMSENRTLTGGIRTAVCFGKDERSDEVKRRFYEVLGVVNAHLPPGIRPIETWSLGERGPQSL